MKNKILIIALAFMMLFGFPISVSGAIDAASDLTQQQLRQLDQDQMKIQIRDRLSIMDSAMLQQHDRMMTRDQTSIQFPDCENHWAISQVTSGWAFGLIEGYPDGNFGPDRNVSGLEGILMMTRLMNCLSGIDAGDTTPGAVDWTGVPDWANLKLQDQNALRLMEQTNFYQDGQMNRLHVAVMMAKGLGLEPADMPAGAALQFMDQNNIPAEHVGYILALKNLGVVIGDDGNFYPDRNVTRAEIATMMVRVLDLLKE